MKLSIPASKVIQAVSVMKLSALVEEVNQEQELLELCDKLCKDLYTVHCESYPSLDYYSWSVNTQGRKYIKIIANSGNQDSVWGFINKKEFTTVRKMERVNGIVEKEVLFKVGDVLASAGWATPSLNAPRGNLLMEGGYPVTRGNQHGPHYLV